MNASINDDSVFFSICRIYAFKFKAMIISSGRISKNKKDGYFNGAGVFIKTQKEVFPTSILNKYSLLDYAEKVKLKLHQHITFSLRI